jgi:hypothetical protein
MSLVDLPHVVAARGPGCVCFHVTGSGPDIPQSVYGALNRDQLGDEHVIAVRRPNTSSQDYAVTYLTRLRGQRDWSARRVAGIPLLTGSVSMLATTTPSGADVFVVANACDSGTVYVGEASLRARRVRMTASYSTTNGDECGGVTAATYQGATALPHHRFALLERDPSPGPAVAIGTVGSTLPAPTVLPNPGGVTIDESVIEEDASSGELVVVASTSEGVFAWRKPSGGPWSMPTRVAPVAKDYRVDSMTIDKRNVAVGLDYARNGGVYVARRTARGHWSTPARLPHSVGADNNLIVAFNPSTGHLHAAFNRERAHGGGGIFETTYLHGRWQPRRHITTKYGDEPQEITVTKQGHAVIGYQHH